MNARLSRKNDSSGGSSPENNDKRDEGLHLTPLRTKLCPSPLRSEWITRSRLVKRLDEGLGHELILISAPAGFGKTTLLVDWVHTHKIPVAWFSVDKGDNDSLNFLTYVILGLQSLEADTGKAALTMLQSLQPPPIEPILINLLNDVSRIATDLAIENGIEQTGIVGSLYGTLGMILCELKDLDEGIRLIKKGIELSKQGRDPVMLGNFRICLQRALM